MRIRSAVLTLAAAAAVTTAACRHAPPLKVDGAKETGAERTARVLTCKAECEKAYATAAEADAAWGGECRTLCRYPDTPTCVRNWCEAECAIANAKGIGPAIGHWCSTGGDGWRICRQSCLKVPTCQDQWCGDAKPARARALAVYRATRDACVATCDVMK